jgi:toxin ParE1/3/4
MGNRQAVKYVAALRQRCRWLAQNPLLGMPRDEIRKGLRSFPQGRHIVFYSVSDDDVFIVGIPHSGMDLAAYFRRPA